MKINSPEAVLSTAYFPPIEYFAVMANSQKVYIQAGRCIRNNHTEPVAA